MSFTKGKGSRSTVVAVRKASLSSEGSPVRLPPLQRESSGSNLQNGLMGNAMAIPPAKLSPELRRSSREDLKIKDPKTLTRASFAIKNEQHVNVFNSAELEKVKRELRESLAREKELKKQAVSLNKSLEELGEEVKEKDRLLQDLQSQLERQIKENKEEYYRELYEKECQNHEDTKNTLNSTKSQLETKIKEVHSLQKEHDTKVQEMTQTFEQKLETLRKEKDEEISIRDQKLNKLKTQMADALSGNSWERQQQLDELSKELKRTQEEADMLRMKIKALQKSTSKPGGCSNCENNITKLSTAVKSNAEKDKYIKELKAMCSKFEKQLTQQDTILKKVAESQGHKVTVYPK